MRIAFATTRSTSLVGPALAGIGMWTLLCLAGWALFALGGAMLQAAIGVLLFWLPGIADLLQALIRFMAGLGAGVVAIVWAAGTALIVIGTMLLNSSAASVYYREAGHTRAPNEPERSPGGHPMKDVTPPQKRSLEDRGQD